MKNLFKQLNLLLLFGLLLSGISHAQQHIKLNLMPESKLWFDGTSTLHDFTCESKKIEANLETEVMGSSLVSNPQFTLDVALLVESLESGKDAMNENMYEALKSEINPKITYSLKSIKSESVGNGRFKLESTGELEIAGIKKTILMIVDAFEEEDGTLQLKGSTPVDMTEYNIEPPSFMFGTIETGKDVLVHFDLKFKKS